MTPREQFDEVIAKGVRDRDSVAESLDLGEEVLRHFEALIDRYLESYRSSAVPEELDALYMTVSQRMLRYGLFLHFICFGSDTRAKFRELSEDELYPAWEEKAVRALSNFRTPGVPRTQKGA
jgi:hypothetical protein